jgi:hypothetical protein
MVVLVLNEHIFKMKISYFKNLLLLLLAATLLINCKKKEEPEPVGEPQIVISPEEIVLTNEDAASIHLSVQPPAEYEWTISSKPSWLVVNPSSGTVNKNPVEIVVKGDPTNIDKGSYAGTLRIKSNEAGSAEVNVNFNLESEPKVLVEPNVISFAAGEKEKKFVISNVGYGIVNWEFKKLPDWIEVDPNSGSLSYGENVEVSAIADRFGLSLGSHADNGLFTINSSVDSVSVGFEVEVEPFLEMTASHNEIFLDYFVDSVYLKIFNRGNIPFFWQFSDFPEELLSAGIYSGYLQKFDSTEVLLTVNRENLETGVYNDAISIQNDGGQELVIPLQVKQFKDEKWYIEGDVVDAEYDKVHDRIIVVKDNPPALLKLDPVQKTVDSLVLNYSPNCVSVKMDGQAAAVGHNSRVSLIDLNNMTIVNEYVSGKAFDILLSTYEWVCVLVEGTGGSNLLQINLQTGEFEKNSEAPIPQKSYARFVPGSNSFYVSNSQYPNPIYKFWINSNGPHYSYNSTYNASGSYFGNIWISESANRLINSEGQILTSNGGFNWDMKPVGSIPYEYRPIVSLDNSEEAEKYILVSADNFNDPDDTIHFFDSDFNHVGAVELAGFLVPNGTGGGAIFSSRCRFIFFNSDGTKIHALVKNSWSSPALKDWAVITVDVE